MKITDISTTILFDPNARALQDATIPKVWKGGGTHIYLHIKTDAGIEGLGYSQAMPAYAVREIIERELKDLLTGFEPLSYVEDWFDNRHEARIIGRRAVD